MQAIKRFSRRRTVQLLAVSSTLGVAAGAPARSKHHYWRGAALGARTEITLAHEDAGEAARITALAQNEIERLENIFSLYRPESALARLNRTGRIDHPPAEFLQLLSLCGALHDATGGAFDPAIQALWAAYAEAGAIGETPDENEIARLMLATGWSKVAFGTDSVWLASASAALTFNGVAQGFIADRLADLMRRNGMRNVLVNAGEISAMGKRDGVSGWRVGVDGPGETVREELTLSDMAIATSSLSGTTFDSDGKASHILDPRTGAPATRYWSQVSVIHPSAAVADGLSTALIVLGDGGARAALSRFPGARVIAFDGEDETKEFRTL